MDGTGHRSSHPDVAGSVGAMPRQSGAQALVRQRVAGGSKGEPDRGRGLRAAGASAVADRRDTVASAPLLARCGGLLVALIVLAYTQWPALRIRFGIIDDHVIADMLGRDERLPVTSMLAQFLAHASEPDRFRPVFWLGQVLEAAVAGQSAGTWYLDRLLLAAVTLTAVYTIALWFVGPASAGIVSLLVFVGPQSETWRRLGAAEAYALPLACVGCALLLGGMTRGRRPARLWPAYLFLLASGMAKENFLLVSSVVIAAGILRYGVRRLGRWDWAVLGSFYVLWAADVAVLAAKVLGHGSQYPQPRNLDTVVAWYSFAQSTMDLWDGLAIGLAAAMALLLVVPLEAASRSRTVVLGATGVVLFVLQIGFYAGGPVQGRYLYPVALLPVAVWGLVAMLLDRVRRQRLRLGLRCLVFAVLALGISRGVESARTDGVAAAGANAAFQTALAQLDAQVVNSGVDAVVVQPSEPLTDAERVLSLARYVNARTGVPVMTLPATSPSDAFSHSLAAMIERWSRQGGSPSPWLDGSQDAAAHDHGRLTPYRPTADCLSIVFGTNKPVCPASVPSPG